MLCRRIDRTKNERKKCTSFLKVFQLVLIGSFLSLCLFFRRRRRRHAADAFVSGYNLVLLWLLASLYT